MKKSAIISTILLTLLASFAFAEERIDLGPIKLEDVKKINSIADWLSQQANKDKSYVVTVALTIISDDAGKIRNTEETFKKFKPRNTIINAKNNILLVKYEIKKKERSSRSITIIFVLFITLVAEYLWHRIIKTSGFMIKKTSEKRKEKITGHYYFYIKLAMAEMKLIELRADILNKFLIRLRLGKNLELRSTDPADIDNCLKPPLTHHRIIIDNNFMDKEGIVAWKDNYERKTSFVPRLNQRNVERDVITKRNWFHIEDKNEEDKENEEIQIMVERLKNGTWRTLFRKDTEFQLIGKNIEDLEEILILLRESEIISDNQFMVQTGRLRLPSKRMIKFLPRPEQKNIDPGSEKPRVLADEKNIILGKITEEKEEDTS